MGWNYLSFPKLQRLHRWSLGMDKEFHPTLNWACDYLSMLGLKLNHVSKRGHWKDQGKHSYLTFWFTGNGLAPHNALFFYTSSTAPSLSPTSKIPPPTSPNFQDIHYYIANVWDICVCSILRYGHHTKFATGCWITIWLQKQNSRKVWLNVLLLFGILSKICFICKNHVCWN